MSNQIKKEAFSKVKDFLIMRTDECIQNRIKCVINKEPKEKIDYYHELRTMYLQAFVHMCDQEYPIVKNPDENEDLEITPQTENVLHENEFSEKAINIFKLDISNQIDACFELEEFYKKENSLELSETNKYAKNLFQTISIQAASYTNKS